MCIRTCVCSVCTYVCVPVRVCVYVCVALINVNNLNIIVHAIVYFQLNVQFPNF